MDSTAKKEYVSEFLWRGKEKIIIVPGVLESELKARETPRTPEPEPGFWADHRVWDLFMKCV